MAVQITGAQIKNGEITTTKIANDAIDATKIADNAIVADAVSAGAITSAKLGASSVLTAALNNLAVTPAKANLTSTWDFTSGTIRVPSVPAHANDAVPKSYLDGIVGGGVYWKEPAVTATTANISLANPGTDTFDDVQLTSGQRLLVKDQTTPNQNGVYDFNGSGSALTRSSDANVASELNGLAIFVKSGTDSADQGFIQTNEIGNLGSDNVTFVQFTGLGQITAGPGLAKSGNTLSANAGAGIEIVADEIRADIGAGLENDGTGSTRVKTDGVTTQLNGSGQVIVKLLGVDSGQIANGAIIETKLGNGSVSTSKLQADCVTASILGAGSVDTTALGNLSVTEGKLGNNAVTASKIAGAVAGAGLAGGAGSALSVNVDSSTIVISGDSLNVGTIGTLQIASDAITAVKIANNAITPAKLHADCAGNGIALDGSTNAIKIDLATSSGLEISSQKLQVDLEASKGLEKGPNGLALDIDTTNFQFTPMSGALRLKALGIQTAKYQDASITTVKIANDAVTMDKVGWQPYQELTTTSNGSTVNIDLARPLHANSLNGVLVFKNGLAMLNKTALGGSAGNADEFSVTATGGAGGNGRIAFGAALASGDSILVHYLK